MKLFTSLEFVGVVSFSGNGLLRANAPQLQKIVNSTKYSKGLEENKKIFFLKSIRNFHILPFN
jgi:hypothetical protein